MLSGSIATFIQLDILVLSIKSSPYCQPWPTPRDFTLAPYPQYISMLLVGMADSKKLFSRKSVGFRRGARQCLEAISIGFQLITTGNGTYIHLCWGRGSPAGMVPDRAHSSTAPWCALRCQILSFSSSLRMPLLQRIRMIYLLTR
jgi:hypothetical protein